MSAFEDYQQRMFNVSSEQEKASAELWSLDQEIKDAYENGSLDYPQYRDLMNDLSGKFEKVENA